jgi:hypothetical protein
MLVPERRSCGLQFLPLWPQVLGQQMRRFGLTLAQNPRAIAANQVINSLYDPFRNRFDRMQAIQLTHENGDLPLIRPTQSFHTPPISARGKCRRLGLQKARYKTTKNPDECLFGTPRGIFGGHARQCPPNLTNPRRGAVDSAVDAASGLSLGSAMLFPASLIPKNEIVVNVRQHMRISFLPEFEGEAVRFENFFGRLGAEVSPPLIRCSRAPEQSAIPRPANPWNRFLAMPIRLNGSSSDAFSQIDKGVVTPLIQAMQDDQQLAGF